MERIKKANLANFIFFIVLFMFTVGPVSAQVGNWEYRDAINITENAGDTLYDFQVKLYINTQSLIAQGKMDSTGDDIRFSESCSGPDLLDYYLVGPMNDDSTKIWVKIDTLLPNSNNLIYMFYGNPSASPATDFDATFPNNVIINNDTTVNDSVWNKDWVEVSSSAALTLGAGTLRINARKIIINGIVDGDGAGYLGGGTPGGDGNGPGGGSGATFNFGTAAYGGGGAGYGGIGGDGEGGTNPGGEGGPAYGKLDSMSIWRGSGGAGGENTGFGGNGGGALILNGLQGGEIKVSGIINMNGQDGLAANPDGGGGGGSGGGILIMGNLVDLQGAIMQTDGGAGGSGAYVGGGGAGGRIKIFSDQVFKEGSYSVRGGSGFQNGDSGSVYKANYTTYEPSYTVLSNISLISSDDDDSICPQQPVTFTAQGRSYQNYSFFVNTTMEQNGANNIFTDSLNNNDSVWVVGTDVNGCKDTSGKIKVKVTTGIGVNADYSYDNSNGLTVDFTDSSENAASYLWTFGDGDSSTLQNPSHTYAGTGDYEVCLMISSTCGMDTLCDTIPVCNMVQADFVSETDGFTLDFTDSSNNATSYIWAFGDGDSATTANPSHQYANDSTYVVCLTAMNECGAHTTCDTVKTVCSQPKAHFGYTTDDLTVSFTDSSRSAFTYQWDFGETNDSTDKDSVPNPVYTYSTGGTYQVCLTVSNPCGTYTVCRDITVCDSSGTGFTTARTNLQVDFTNTSTNMNDYIWSFGNGDSSTATHPTYTYADSGVYQVCLTASNSCETQTTCQMVNVKCDPGLPTAGFNYNMDGLTISLTNNSSNANSYWWRFGDGNGSNSANPTYTYSQSGTYTVTLIADNTCGADSAKQTITVTGMAEKHDGATRWSVYPNPNDGSFEVTLPDMQEEAVLTITNLVGEVVYSQTLAPSDTKYNLNLRELKAGLYFVRIKDQNGKATVKKLVIK